ncbi:deoxyribose-phosphate aldolase [Paracrocinitomix mangrovi]|uniref:deoxyribose-phosphate aldolase n=1 Tax=Paracrocinitomix mangrovi TaxID=2862509 RepID=UPI001C8E8DE2|nr:deoxyribose-phosphate aldolase [Paracrocinitomix mangrovi]UKN03416.1 deoxyribose-phosphate aldolase [Paracrocinitomix mangrovi]
MHKNQILTILSLIDLTTLNDNDTENVVEQLVNKANTGFENVHPAAVCVYSNFGNFAANISKTKVAVVGGCFPSGQTLIEAKAAEYKLIQQLNVDEVDIVINRGDLIASDFENVAKDVKAARSIFTNKSLKVIIESGELNAELIKKASEIAISEGADFIKTSTGKSKTGATPEAAQIMCNVIQNHFTQTGKKIGFKASGGIRTKEDADKYINIVKNTLGDEWINPSLLRIGASSLYDNLIDSLKA